MNFPKSLSAMFIGSTAVLCALDKHIHYDAVDKTLYINSQIGDDFCSFFSCETGFGTVGLTKGKPFVEMRLGNINTQEIIVSGKSL
ncbi:MAG: hypothetical protein ACYSUD_09030 [Planctomycetota bacterium]